MLWDIKIDNQPFNECFDCIITSISEYYGHDSKLLQLGCFSPFFYNVEEGARSFHDKILRGVSIWRTAQDLFHMRVERISLESERLLQVIRSKISDTPICVQIDPYDCEWSDFYQKEHWTHHLVICDIDEEKRIYYCADIYYPSKKHILVPFDALENMCNSIDVIHPEKDACVGAEIVMNYMKRYLNMSVPTVRDEESKLLHLFLNEFNFDSIGNPKQLNTSILLIKLSWIAVDKRLFCEGLKHIEQTILRNRFFENIYEPLALVEKKINVLKNTLIKCSLTKIMQYNSIVQLIKEIVCLNSYILTILQDALKELNA